MATRNQHSRKWHEPMRAENIKQPGTSGAATARLDTEIKRPTHPKQERLHKRKRPQPADPAPAALDGDVIQPDPGSVLNRQTPPRTSDLQKITRQDVELFFEAAHAFRTNLAGVLPKLADKIGRFMLAVPYTILDIGGRPHQLVADVNAMTPIQARLAGLVVHRLLPPLTDMDIEGRRGPGQGTTVDARSVRITVNTVAPPDGANRDVTDERLREQGIVPGAARQVAPIRMNLGEVVRRARELTPDTNMPDVDVIKQDDDADAREIEIIDQRK